MTAFHDLIVAEVRRRGGVTFEEYMRWALYHPLHGYYAAGPARTGRGGDFFTSVQAGPLFGSLLAETFAEMWDHLGSERLTLVELGGSDGVLAERVITALGEKGRARGLVYRLVEASPARRAEARRRLSRFPRVEIVESLEALEHPSEGCVFSNEFFDALPFHRVTQECGALKELWVREESGRLAQRAGPLSTPLLARALAEQSVSLEEGQEAEVCLALEAAVGHIARVLSRGFVLTLDYGEPSADLYRPERRRGTLQVYHRHRLSDDPFENIGECDLTALVDFGRLARLGAAEGLRPLIFARQGAFLLNSGEKVLRRAVEETPRRGAGAAAQVQQLLHPDALGGRFQVLVQGKEVAEPVLSGGRINRIGRLALEGAS
ncbi:MAG: class I SAM-dependent methyltransferase [Elusimicrobiota bacterium]